MSPTWIKAPIYREFFPTKIITHVKWMLNCYSTLWFGRFWGSLAPQLVVKYITPPKYHSLICLAWCMVYGLCTFSLLYLGNPTIWMTLWLLFLFATATLAPPHAPAQGKPLQPSLPGTALPHDGPGPPSRCRAQVHRSNLPGKAVVEHGATTWRIIPLSKWLITMVNMSPKLGCSPVNGG